MWNTSLSNELDCLAQGFGEDRLPSKYVKGTNTIFFIHKSQVHTYTKVTYANLVCDINPLKIEKHIVCMTVGGYRLDYDGELSFPAISLLDTKIFLNNVISNVDKGATFSTIDVKNHYLQRPMEKY